VSNSAGTAILFARDDDKFIAIESRWKAALGSGAES
jgi:hypothetical protein